MAINIFGFKIKKDEKQEPTVVVDQSHDGATQIVDYGGVYFDGYEDILKSIKNESHLIKLYREISHIPEVDQAISEIVNDAVVYPKNESFPVQLNLDEVEASDNIKDKVIEEFENIMAMLNFDTRALDLFREWYIDGRLPVYIQVDEKRKSKGISKLVPIDPTSITKVREIKKSKDGKDAIEKIVDIQTYYVYNPDANTPREFTDMSYGNYNIQGRSVRGIKLTEDSVAYATSGKLDESRKYIISHLHKALKTAKQLCQIEDSMIIYRLSRAPERRVFYVDVGNLPKQKAEMYLQSLMSRFRNKLSYDSKTGEIQNQTHQKSILEDFWLPRREGGKGTEISTLGGGDGFAGITEETQYFKNKLYKALNVPTGRLDSDSTFVFGQSGEISREEVKFSKFIGNLRTQFGKSLFDKLLETQLVLKNVIKADEFEILLDNIIYVWGEDSHFAEMKKLDVLMKRLEVLGEFEQYRDKYFSKTYARKNILFQPDEEVEELKKERKKEKTEEPDPEEDDF